MNTNKVIQKINNDKILNEIKNFAQENFEHAKIYVVGGVFRDFWLDKENFDKDIVIDGVSAQKFTKSLAERLNATFIPLDEENKIYRLVLEDKINCIDIAEVVGENIEQDLKRRDLTINSVAVNLSSGEIIDINNGIEDLKNKKIREISEQNFLDDPLRLLRVYRFEAMLGFEIDKDLQNIVRKHADKIKKSAVERISYELLKLFGGAYSFKALFDMDEAGLLARILPISQDLKTVPPNLHHHLDLFNHSIEVVKQIQEIYQKGSAEVKEHLDNVEFGPVSRLAHLKLAGFLHDIGKPSTWTIEENTGRHRFIKHDDVGAKMSVSILKKLKCSKKQIDYMAKMIKYHIYPSHVVQSPELSEKIYMRLIRKMDADVIDVITLAMADRLSARGEEITDEIVANNLSNLQKLLDYYLSIKDTLEPLEKLLSGDEIMEIFNIKPSKELGVLIESLKEAQISGDVTTKEEAIGHVKSLLACVCDIT